MGERPRDTPLAWQFDLAGDQAGLVREHRVHRHQARAPPGAVSRGRYRPQTMPDPSTYQLGDIARAALVRAVAERLGDLVPVKTTTIEAPGALHEAIDQLAALVVAGRGEGALRALRAHVDETR